MGCAFVLRPGQVALALICVRRREQVVEAPVVRRDAQPLEQRGLRERVKTVHAVVVAEIDIGIAVQWIERDRPQIVGHRILPAAEVVFDVSQIDERFGLIGPLAVRVLDDGQRVTIAAAFEVRAAQIDERRIVVRFHRQATLQDADREVALVQVEIHITELGKRLTRARREIQRADKILHRVARPVLGAQDRA